MEGKGKGDGHQHGRKPRIPEPVLIVWNSPSEEVSGHWAPAGVEPINGWMDGCRILNGFTFDPFLYLTLFKPVLGFLQVELNCSFGGPLNNFFNQSGDEITMLQARKWNIMEKSLIH